MRHLVLLLSLNFVAHIVHVVQVECIDISQSYNVKYNVEVKHSANAFLVKKVRLKADCALLCARYTCCISAFMRGTHLEPPYDCALYDIYFVEIQAMAAGSNTIYFEKSPIVGMWI